MGAPVEVWGSRGTILGYMRPSFGQEPLPGDWHELAYEAYCDVAKYAIKVDHIVMPWLWHDAWLLSMAKAYNEIIRKPEFNGIPIIWGMVPVPVATFGGNIL